MGATQAQLLEWWWDLRFPWIADADGAPEACQAQIYWYSDPLRSLCWVGAPFSRSWMDLSDPRRFGMDVESAMQIVRTSWPCSSLWPMALSDATPSGLLEATHQSSSQTCHSSEEESIRCHEAASTFLRCFASSRKTCTSRANVHQVPKWHRGVWMHAMSTSM